MEPILVWIDHTDLSLFIQTREWVIPSVQSVHILAVAMTLSSVGMIVLRLLGLAGLRTSVADTVKRYVPWIWGSLVVLALSGSVLVIGEPHRELKNPAFQLKMVMILLAVLIVATFQGNVYRHSQSWNREPEPWRVRIIAVATMILFFAIAVAGRWIAYLIADYSGGA
jgi:hypothetical protein